MGKLKKFVKKVQKKPVLKWTVGILFILIGIFGCLIPVLQGFPMVLLGGIVLIPNEKLSKKIFKYEKALTITIIISISLMLIAPAVLFATGMIPPDTTFGKYGSLALHVLQVGQEPIRNTQVAIGLR